jgi:hypothetical protein
MKASASSSPRSRVTKERSPNRATYAVLNDQFPAPS